jgi:hypothetical protein
MGRKKMIKPNGLSIHPATTQYPGYPILYDVHIRDIIFIGQLTYDSLHIQVGEFTLTNDELHYLAEYMENMKHESYGPHPR